MKRISKRTRILVSVAVMSIVTGVFFTNCAQNGFNVSDKSQSDSDPFLDMAWHISNVGQRVFSSKAGTVGNDLNLLKTWTSGISGKGIKVLISDDGVQDTHEDLKANYLYSGVSKDYTKASPYLANSSGPRALDDNHATAVAGLVAAVAGNGVGTKGVAFEASLISANFLSSAIVQSESAFVDQASGDFDVFNMSWGATQNNLSNSVISFWNQMKFGVTSGRSGKGSIYVKSAGNDFAVKCRGSSSVYCVGNSNFDGDNVTPYTIITAALDAAGVAASYSSPGSNIWISSLGGEPGEVSPGIITTDRMGCTNGYSVSNVVSKYPFEKGGLGNTGCNYTSTFNGTSAAAPILTGAVALLIQANPNLTWRDVKYILAKTATQVGMVTNGISHPAETTPSGYIWEQSWIQNAAGFRFHNWYGFGRVNVDAAVAMARSYTSPLNSYLETFWADDRSSLNLSIPDNNATGVTDTMYVATNVKIESVQIKVWVTHDNIADLAIELTSPSGTKSIIINMNNSLRHLSNYQGEVFLSNAFYRENSQGNWQIRVLDGKSTYTGTLTRWSLNFTGSH